MISFHDVSKSFGPQQVLEGVSFTVRCADRVGIVGPNGAGKSTIFELITGRLSPDRGELSVPANARIGYVRQQVGALRSDLSLVQYSESALSALRDIQAEIAAIESRLAELPSGDRRGVELRRLGELQTSYESLGGYELRSRAETVLSGLGFDTKAFHQPFQTLSSGWRMRAELARTLVSGPDILLLDEPTNYLDVVAVEWLQGFLRTFRGTLMLVSHDRYLLNALTAVTLEVVRTQVTRYGGNYERYTSRREQRRRQLLAAQKNQQRKREQIERFIERFRAKNTKASQVQSRLKMLERMEDIVVPQDVMQPPRIRLPRPPRAGDEVVSLENAGISYASGPWVLRHVDLRIENGERIAVVGLNGMGKTSLLRVLAGRLPLKEGRRHVGRSVMLGYQAQDVMDVMDPSRSVFETAKETAADRSDSDVRELLGGFRFSGGAVDKKVQVLSGGEKARLALVSLLLRPCNFLILDEPTTHLDIAAREALEQALRDYSGTLCLVSHDVDFLRHLATTVFAVGPAGVKRYYGGYDYYREKLARDMAAMAEDAAQDTEPCSGRTERKARRREEALKRQELAVRRRPFEERIGAAEARAAALEAEQRQLLQHLEGGAQAVDYAESNRRLAEIQSELAGASDEWERAAVELEELLAEFGEERPEERP